MKDGADEILTGKFQSENFEVPTARQCISGEINPPIFLSVSRSKVWENNFFETFKFHAFHFFSFLTPLCPFLRPSVNVMLITPNAACLNPSAVCKMGTEMGSSSLNFLQQ
jgi:hypothetical protein